VKKYPSIKYIEDPFKKDHLRAWVTLKTTMETEIPENKMKYGSRFLYHSP